ncbi:MAG: zinc ribbon domain-containing protein [Deltaproteobacteria bacterium]|nr:zinc ribbon domain-containing protein [Deltaproteobacteria bacterium]
MPIYEYLCESCETLTERIQKVGDPGPTKCPECGSRKIAKLVSRTTFQLKGGGWYSDLYASPRKDADRKGTHTPKEAAAPEPSTPAAESKPAAKPEGPASKPSGAPRKGKRG